MDLLFTVWRWTFSWRFVLKLKTKKIYLSRKFFLQVLLLLVSLDTLNCQWALAKKNCFLLFLFFFFLFGKCRFYAFWSVHWMPMINEKKVNEEKRSWSFWELVIKLYLSARLSYWWHQFFFFFWQVWCLVFDDHFWPKKKEKA